MRLVPPTLTPTQQLATVLLGRDLRQWVAERREPRFRRSWRVIANELQRETEGRVTVSGEAIRSWFPDLDDALEDVG